MEVFKIIFLIAVATALSITITMQNMSSPIEEEKPPFSHVARTTMSLSSIKKEQEHDRDDHKLVLPASKRVSRFLDANHEKNPRAADHCHKDHEICKVGGVNATCCNNKCIDLSYDDNNCGACKKKCKYTQTCCRGECVDLAFDKRHCGQCNNRCSYGEYCIYGMCDYA